MSVQNVCCELVMPSINTYTPKYSPGPLCILLGNMMAIIHIYILCINIYESKKKKFCSKVYMKIYRRIKYEDITDLTPAEGRETPYSIQMQIAQVREIQGGKPC